MGQTNELGLWGERMAAKYLMEQGYTFLAHSYRCRYGEIDLIMEQGKYLVFVEVKLRKTDRYGTPAEYVTAEKQQKLRRTALTYLQENGCKKQPRFDVVELYAPQGMKTSPVPVHHIENAF